MVNRFTASLLSSDPLNTFYTLVLGRTPNITKVGTGDLAGCGLRTGVWCSVFVVIILLVCYCVFAVMLCCESCLLRYCSLFIVM